jgi:hypothetical protein
VILNAKVAAPGFKDVSNTTTLTISYSSGIDEKGNPYIKTKWCFQTQHFNSLAL